MVGFDAYAWLLTDPVTEVGGSPLADIPWLPELPRQIRLKYLTPLNRWTTLSQPPVACLRSVTGDHPEESLVWRELLVRYDVSDVASVVFRDRYGCWAFLELWRTRSTRRYGDAEADLLSAIAEPVTTALRRCQARTFEFNAPSPERTGPVVLMLTADLEVRAQTPETRSTSASSCRPTRTTVRSPRARTTSPRRCSPWKQVSTTTHLRHAFTWPTAYGSR